MKLSIGTAVQTRHGKEAEIVSHDMGGDRPIFARWRESADAAWIPAHVMEDGRVTSGVDSPFDIIPGKGKAFSIPRWAFVGRDLSLVAIFNQEPTQAEVDAHMANLGVISIVEFTIAGNVGDGLDRPYKTYCPCWSTGEYKHSENCEKHAPTT